MSFVRPAVDVSIFSKMCADLARVSARKFEPTVRHEVSKVIQTAMRGTKVAVAGKIRKRFKTSRFVHFDGKTYYLGNLYSDELWAAVQVMRRDSLAKKLKARGLARQSWWLMGQQILPFDAPAFVKDALASSGREHPENIEVKAEGSNKRFTLEITNDQPTVLIDQVNGRRAFINAVNKRTSFYRQNLRRGVFDNIANIAKKYPGFYTR
jgi:hypothetical protein